MIKHEDLTDEQKDIIEAFKQNKSLMIEAVPGSGKTETILQLLKYVDKSSIVLSFNKNIQEEMNRKVNLIDNNTLIQVRTFNSLGNDIFLGKELNSLYDYLLVQEQIKQDSYYNYKLNGVLRKSSLGSFIVDMIDKFMITLLEPTYENYIKLKNDFNLDYDDSEDFHFKNGIRETAPLYKSDHLTILEHIKTILEKRKKVGDKYSYRDQQYTPLFMPNSLDKFDYIFVDEVQDLNLAQIKMLELIVKDNSVLVLVGDRLQTLYKFRGSFHNSMNYMKDKFKLEEYPLTTCFRCPTSHIDFLNATSINTKIRPFNDKKGSIIHLTKESFFDKIPYIDDSTILCRNNADIMEIAIKFLSYNKKVKINNGSDILKQIEGVYKKHKKMSDEDYFNYLVSGVVKVSKKIENEKDAMKKRNMIQKLDLIKLCIMLLRKNNKSREFALADLRKIINVKNSTKLTTIHSFKGGEDNIVYFYGYDKFPLFDAQLDDDDMAQEEINMLNVALSRSKDTLYIVNTKTKKKRYLIDKSEIP